MTLDVLPSGGDYDLYVYPDKAGRPDDLVPAKELQQVLLDLGVRDGDVYQYIGPTVDVYDFTSGDGSRILQNDDDHQTRVKVGSDIYVWEGTDGASRNLGTEDYDGPDDDGDGRGDGNENWRLEVIPLAPADVAAKVKAVDYYRSQLDTLFHGTEAMPSQVWGFAASRSPEAGLAERIWWPSEA